MKAARFYLEHLYLDEGDVNEYRWMARSRRPVALLSETTGDRIQSSVRYREVIGPLGLMYEVRSVSTMGGELWGAIDLAREHGRPDFSAREVTLLRRIAPHLGAGLKAAVLRSQASAETNSDGAPEVLILDNRGRVLYQTTGAERFLADLGDLGPGWQEGDGGVGGNRGAAPGAKSGDGARSSKRSARVCSGEIGPVANTAGFYERVASGQPGRDSAHHRAGRTQGDGVAQHGCLRPEFSRA